MTSDRGTTEYEFERRRFGDQAVDLLREQFDASPLMGRFCSELPIEGTVWALVPLPNPPELIERVKSGLGGPPHEEDLLVPYVRAFLDEPELDVQRVLLFEEPMGRRGQPHIGPPDGPEFFCGEIPFPVADRTWSDERLAWFLGFGLGPFGLGLLSRVPRDLRLQPGVDVDQAAVNDLVVRSAAVLVPAWDGERFMIWEREPLRWPGLPTTEQAQPSWE
jgi:hypothetical protein